MKQGSLGLRGGGVNRYRCRWIDFALNSTECSFNFFAADPNSLNDIIWDLIHSYNPEVLKNAVMLYKTTLPPRQDIPKKEIPELNTKV